MNQVQRAKDGRANNNQTEHRNHEITRPRFLPSKSVSDQRHENSDDCNERRCDVQPFRARDALTAHDVRPDIENREQDRQVHSDGSQTCEPGQDSDREWSLQRFVLPRCPAVNKAARLNWVGTSSAFNLREFLLDLAKAEFEHVVDDVEAATFNRSVGRLFIETSYQGGQMIGPTS